MSIPPLGIDWSDYNPPESDSRAEEWMEEMEQLGCDRCGGPVSSDYEEAIVTCQSDSCGWSRTFSEEE